MGKDVFVGDRRQRTGRIGGGLCLPCCGLNSSIGLVNIRAPGGDESGDTNNEDASLDGQDTTKREHSLQACDVSGSSFIYNMILDHDLIFREYDIPLLQVACKGPSKKKNAIIKHAIYFQKTGCSIEARSLQIGVFCRLCVQKYSEHLVAWCACVSCTFIPKYIYLGQSQPISFFSSEKIKKKKDCLELDEA